MVCILTLLMFNSVSLFDNIDSIQLSNSLQVNNVVHKSSGIDLSPSLFDFQYVSDTDYLAYGLLSSYDCCDTVDRPDTLWVVDGMLNKEQKISVTIENRGIVDSGQFDLRVLVEHNEYSDFVLFEQLIQVDSITATSSKIVEIKWIPDYSGNHTIRAITSHPQDSDIANDVLSRHYTIGNIYENADNVGVWSTMSNYWSIDQDTGISPHDFSSFSKNSFYVGDTSINAYGNNWDENMETSFIDFSDRVNSPQKPFQISFLASGASRSGDYLNLQILNSQNSWKTLGSLSNVIDPNGENWNLFNYFLDPQEMNSNSKIRFNFDSNAVNTDVGYWIDDFVMVYDQAAKNIEYSPKIATLSNGEASAEEWSTHQLQIINQGNLEDRVYFEMKDLPDNWLWSINYLNGGPVDNQIGIEIPKGESRSLELKIRPADDSNIGIEDLSISVISFNSPGISKDSKEFKLDVLPTYLPKFQFEEESGYCRPGNVCEFNVSLINAGDADDIFSISSENFLIRNEWTFGIAWNQVQSLELSPGDSAFIQMVVDVPTNAIAGQFSSIILTATSNERPDVEVKFRVNATAGMVSNAFMAVDIIGLDSTVKEPIPGSTVELPFKIWNNASAFDIFELCFIRQGFRSWVIESEFSESIIVDGEDCANPHVFEVQGLSSREIKLSIHVPENAQKSDSGPSLIPVLKSLRSGETIPSIEFNHFSVRMVSNLTISNLESNYYMNPGSQNILTFEINNFGNGADIVNFNVENLDYDWEYWFTDGVEVIENYQISPIYDGGSNIKINLHVLVPQEVESQKFIDFYISVVSIQNDNEINLSNNLIEYSGETAMLFLPEWVISPINQISTAAGEEIRLNATLANLGNSVDKNLKVKFELESNNDISDINVFLKVPMYSDEYYSESEWASIPLGKQQFANIEILVIIPAETIVPTDLNLKWIVQGGSNQLGISKNLSNITKIDISIYRNVFADFNFDVYSFDLNERIYFSIDLVSSSTVIEELELKNVISEGGELSCDDPSKDGEFKVIIPASNYRIEKISRLDCSLVFNTPGLKEVDFRVVDKYGNLLSSLGVEIDIMDSDSKNRLHLLFSENAGFTALFTLFTVMIIILLAIFVRQKSSIVFDDTLDIIALDNSNNLHMRNYNLQNQDAMNLNNSLAPSNNLKINNDTDYLQPTKFILPKSRPPESDNSLSLEDAFGSLLGNEK